MAKKKETSSKEEEPVINIVDRRSALLEEDKLDQINEQIAEEIIQFAIACGSHVCKGLGAIDAQPYREDIDKLLFSNPLEE